MSTEILRQQLIESLRSIYGLEAFGALADLLQGESLALTYLLEHQGREVYPSDLSRELHLSRSRITGALTSLGVGEPDAKTLIALIHRCVEVMEQ